MLTPEHAKLLQIALESAEYDGKTADQAFAYLHAPGEPQIVTETRPKPMTLTGIMTLLGPESIGKLVNNPNLTDIRDKIIGQDFNGVALWGQLLVAGAVITTQEYAAIAAALQETEEIEISRTEPPAPIAVLSKTEGVSGFPNTISEEEFLAVWKEARE